MRRPVCGRAGVTTADRGQRRERGRREAQGDARRAPHSSRTRSKCHRIANNDPTPPIDGTRRRRVMAGGTGNQAQHGN